MEVQRSTTERLIAHVMVICRNRTTAEERPDAAKGLLKVVAFHEARCCALMDQICADHSAGLEPYRVISHARSNGGGRVTPEVRKR